MNIDIVDNPPFWPSQTFNSSLFYDSESLTRTEADSLYLSIKFITALSATPGVVEASKFVIVDSNKDITGFNNITMTGSSAHLTLSGNASGIDLNGINSNLTISGANGHLIILDTEGGNKLGTLGTIRNAGGASFGNTLYINSTTNDVLTIENSSSLGRANIKFINDSSLALEIGVRGSTASSNPSTYYTYFNGAYRMLMNIAGDIQFLSTTDSSSTTTGSIIMEGGCAIKKKLYVANYAEFNSTVRVTGINTPSSGAGIEFNYSSSIANIYSYDRSASSYKKINFNDLVTYDKSNNLVTSRANYDIGASLFLNDSIASGLINVNNTNKRMYIQTPDNAGYGVLSLNKHGIYWNPSTSNPFNECNPNSLLDFGNKASPFSINLFGGTYGISANNSSLQLCTGGNSISFYTGASYDISTYLAHISNTGSFSTAGGVRVTGSSTSGYSGSSLELEYVSGSANIFAYNRSTLLYRPMTINNTMFMDGLGHLGIGTSATSWICEMGYNTQSVSSYGYLNSGGSTGFSGGSGAVSFSLRTNGRIACGGEIDVFSDRRVKSEIVNISEDDAILFVENIEPKHYCFRPDSLCKYEYGYIAQDVAKVAQKNNSKLDILITPISDYGLKEEVDSDGFISPENTLLTINYIKIIPLIHKYMLKQKKQIDEQQKQINEVKQSLQTSINFLLQENKENNERIDELVDIVQELLDTKKNHHNNGK